MREQRIAYRIRRGEPLHRFPRLRQESGKKAEVGFAHLNELASWGIPYSNARALYVEKKPVCVEKNLQRGRLGLIYNKTEQERSCVPARSQFSEESLAHRPRG
jgi:hypothetical protein